MTGRYICAIYIESTANFSSEISIAVRRISQVFSLEICYRYFE